MRQGEGDRERDELLAIELGRTEADYQADRERDELVRREAGPEPPLEEQDHLECFKPGAGRR